jgi:protocatechuate 3,4-dioxygenase beta subunit
MLGALGATGALLLVGCSDDGVGTEDTSSSTAPGSSTTTSSITGDTPTTGGSQPGTSSGESTGDASSSTGPGADCNPADAWATGGTAAMTAKDCYPDPFAGGVQSCVLICGTTAGPCTADTMDREDVSEGLGGLPVRLALLIVDATTCMPVPGARVEIWHTQRTGVYSGNTPNPGFCAGGDADAPNHLYFRGSRTADDDGRVDFDTCYPGWYPGRAIHIHFRVYLGDQATVTSQLFFDDALSEQIFASHPDYSEFGQPNTTNDVDNVIGGEDDLSPYLLDVARMPDGAMLASKVIGVRTDLNADACTLGNGMMPPPMP